MYHIIYLYVNIKNVNKIMAVEIKWLKWVILMINLSGEQ